MTGIKPRATARLAGVTSDTEATPALAVTIWGRIGATRSSALIWKLEKRVIQVLFAGNPEARTAHGMMSGVSPVESHPYTDARHQVRFVRSR